MVEKRSESRLLCADMLEVCWKEGARRHRASALLEDISSAGACLQLEAPVPVGVEIGWQSAGAAFRGTVCYCVYREIGYFAGVRFAGDCKWSRHRYQPPHLVDLTRLAGLLEPQTGSPAATDSKCDVILNFGPKSL